MLGFTSCRSCANVTLNPRYFRRKFFTSKILKSYHDIEIAVGNSEPIKLSFGKLARFADGSVVAKSGNTSVMVTAVSKNKPSSAGFLPLTVDYRQKAAAVGRIPTNFFRRELGPSEHETLTSRLIDRSLRPLFKPDFFYETQIISNNLAIDGINDPIVLSINAASAALALSDIPWNGPVGAVRVGLVGSDFVINPTRREMTASSMDLVVVATDQNLVVMLEATANNILQQDFMKAIKLGVKECQKIVHSISQLQKECGKPKKEFDSSPVNEDLFESIQSLCTMRLKEIFQDFSHDKLSRDDAVKSLRTDVLEKLKAEHAEISSETFNETFNSICKKVFRELVLDNGIRCDGRSLNDLRKISCEVDLYKPLHGSSLFQRGQTQVLSTVSLDSLNSVMHVDPMTALVSGIKEKNFFLHYEFPPFATKEVGRLGTVRREVGHGALAERALRAVVPTDFSLAMRLTCEVLESNGSSSMGSVCGGSLALLDAGVPLLAPAAGVAIGLISRPPDPPAQPTHRSVISDYRILTDISGIEDYMGDMDFKIAGTKKGITALQADIKIPGLPLKATMEAIIAGCDAKSKIIDIMNEVINEPRKDKKDSWPLAETLDVPINKRGRLIGPGGINLRKILVNTGAQISFDEESGLFNIFAPNAAAMNEAKDFISKLLTVEKEPVLEFGGVYTAKVVEVRDHGVMVVLYNTMKPALVHTSQLDQRKVADARVLGFEVGQEFPVKYFGVDPVSGQMRLSRKVLMGPAPSTLINYQDS